MPPFIAEIQFFVETDAARGNKAIFGFLQTPEPDAMEGLRDRNNEPHRVWQLSKNDAIKLLNSRADVGAEFTIWKRLENSGPIYRVFFSKTSGDFSSKKDDPLQGGRVFKHLPYPAEPYRDEDIPF